MNKTVRVLSGVTFLAILAMVVLILFDVLHIINWVKYIILLSSVFLTFLSLGLFLRKNETTTALTLAIALLLILPCLLPLIALFQPEFITNYWEMFVGGCIFQIGTGIFTLSDGFRHKKKVGFYQVANNINYVLFLVFALVLIFNFSSFLNPSILFMFGAILSVLSLLLLFLRRKAI